MGIGTVKVPVSGIFIFSGGIGTGIVKNWYRKKVSEPVSLKFGIGKKSRNRYRKNLVPKKVPVSVSEIFGTGKKYRYRYRLKFWVPSHTGGWHKVSGPNISPVLFTQIPAGPRSQQCVLTSPSSWGSSLPGFTVSVNDNMINSCAASTQY